MEGVSRSAPARPVLRRAHQGGADASALATGATPSMRMCARSEALVAGVDPVVQLERQAPHDAPFLDLATRTTVRPARSATVRDRVRGRPHRGRRPRYASAVTRPAASCSPARGLAASRMLRGYPRRVQRDRPAPPGSWPMSVYQTGAVGVDAARLDITAPPLEARRSLASELDADLGERGYPDLRPGHAALFLSVDRRSGSRLTDLADQTRLTKQAMMSMVDDLETRGYVRRVPDPADARAKLVRPTAHGRRASAECRRAVQALEQRTRRLLGDRSYDALRRRSSCCPSRSRPSRDSGCTSVRPRPRRRPRASRPTR